MSWTHLLSTQLWYAQIHPEHGFMHNPHWDPKDIKLCCIWELSFNTRINFFSDNGLPFSWESLQKFLASQYISHIISSCYCPKSYGFIERQIKTIKTALHTAKSLSKSLDELLLSLRSTPIGLHLPSPIDIYIKGPITDQDTLPPHRFWGSQRLLNNTEVSQ